MPLKNLTVQGLTRELTSRGIWGRNKEEREAVGRRNVWCAKSACIFVYSTYGNSQINKLSGLWQFLHLHNLVWHHAILCKEVIEFKLKKLTIRKFYRSYFHNITSHAPVQTSIISGRSTNAEEHQRVFNALKNISKATSSYQPDQIVGNMFIRLQAEGKLKGSCPSILVLQEQNNRVLFRSLQVPYHHS